MPTQRSRRPSLYGLNSPLTGLQQEPLVQKRDPNSADSAEIGAIWCNTISHSFFILTSIDGNVNYWTSTTGGATNLTSLTVDPGDITVVAGDINVTAGNLTMAPASTTTLGILSAGAATFGSTVAITGDTTIGGTLDVTGAVSILSDLDVQGDVSVLGDFDLTSADAISLASTSNTAPAISLTANGGPLESIFIQSSQGTSSTSVEINSIFGGVAISAGLADVDALHFTASDDAGGMLFSAGTNGYFFDADDGRFLVETGTGPINVGTDAAAKLITIGNATGITGVNVNTGTGGFKLVALADIDVTATNAAFNLNADNGITLNSINGGINVGSGNNAHPINIGTGAALRLISIGNNTVGTALSLVSGTGNITASSAGTLLLDSVGVLELNSSAGVIGIGNDAVSQNINIGTAGVRTITMGNITGATGVSINVGTSALNLGTGATAHATNVGSTTAGSTLVLNTPTGTNVAAANGVSVTTAGRGVSLPGGLLVISGAGSPSGVVTAPIGSLYLNSTAASAVTRAYINTDGGTVWTNITCAA